MFARRRLRHQKGGALAEFGPVLWFFLLLVVIPFIDLLSFGWAVGTVMFISTMAARQCAGAMTFGEAQTSVTAAEKQMAPFLGFARTTPGFGATGVKLEVLVTPVDSSKTGPPPFGAAGSIPNSAASPSDINTPTYNTSNCVYQYLVTAKYDVMPIFNFHATGLTFLQQVPALGQPVPVTYTATSAVEHTDGLNTP